MTPMSEVEIRVAGRSYRIGCGPGEEERVRQLGQRIETEAAALQSGLGPMAETRLLVLAALVLADKLDETEAAAARLSEAPGPADAPAPEGLSTDLFGHDREEAVVNQMHGLAERIEGLVAQMRRAGGRDT